jgi:uroporphyrinogen-III synthase
MPPQLPADQIKVERVITIGQVLAEKAYTDGRTDTERIVLALGYLAAAVVEYAGTA